MKRIVITFIVILSFFNSGNAQININIQGGFGVVPGGTTVPAFACQPNTFSLQLNASSTIFFLVDPDSTIYLRIDASPSIEFPNLVTLPNSNASGDHFFPLFHNTGSTVDTFRLDTLISTPMVVNCNLLINAVGIANKSQLIGLYNNGADVTTIISGDFNGSSIFSNLISYNVYYPYLQSSNQQSSIGVDYLTHRLPNNRFYRELSYVNIGGDTVTSMELSFKFSDSIDCPSFQFDSIHYYIDNGNPINIPFTLVGRTVTTNTPTTILMRKGEVLHIRETVQLLDNCFLSGCLVPARTFDANLNWGCDSLCLNISNPTVVERGSLRSHLTINRISPASTATINVFNWDCYWDTLFSLQPTTLYTFRIANRDSDVVNNVQFVIEDAIGSNMYFITDSNNIVVTPSFSGSRNFTTHSILYDTTSKKPFCVINTYPNAIKKFNFYIDYLMPNDSMDITIPLVYCCPSNDDGANPLIIDLFEEPKALNTWAVTAAGNSDCSPARGAADNGISNPPLLNIYGSQFSLNDVQSPDREQLYLKQDFIPNGISFNVPQDSLCSSPTRLALNNIQFNQDVNYAYRWDDANIFTKEFSEVATDTILVDSLFIQFRIKTEPGLRLDNLMQNYTMTNGLQTWVASQFSMAHPDSCRLANVYTITFSSNDFPFTNPAVPFLKEIYDVVNSGDFNFNIKGCCCDSINNNPNYIIETLIAGYDFCFIPMSRVDGKSEIHCPGCNMPGTIVTTPDDRILERTNFGFTDTDDNGLAEVPLARIDSTYLNTNRTVLDVNHSMVGDTLSSTMTFYIDDNGAVDLDSLNSLGIYLNYLYAEQKIERSNSNKFDVSPYQITITARGQSVTLTPASGMWNVIVKDVRDSIFNGTPYDLVFYNLGTYELGILFNIANYTFGSNEEISIKVLMRVCKNYQGDRTSKSLADNQFSSKVSLNIYLTDMDLVDMGMFNAYSNSIIPIAQDDSAQIPRSNRLYMCEMKSAMHYFYSVYAKSLSSIYQSLNSPCLRILQIDHEVAIGGEKINPFSFEVRRIPEFFPITVTLPTGNANYQFFNNGVASSYVRTNYSTLCGIPSLHKSTTDSNLVFSNLINYTHTIGSEQLISSGSLTPACGSNLTGQGNIFYSGDEYLKQSLSFPFTYTVCGTTSTHLDSSSVVTNLNLTTCSQTPLTVLNEVNPILAYNTIVSNFVYSIQINPPAYVNATTHRVQWPIRIENSNPNDRNTRNIFIYFADTVPYSNITVQGSPPMFRQLPNGRRIVYFQFTDPIRATFDSIYTIFADINDCSLDSFPCYVGFDCDSFPTFLEIQNGSICQLDTFYLRLNIEEPNVSGHIDQNVELTTCEIDTVSATCDILGSNIYDFRFRLDILNPSLRVIGVRILRHYNNNTSALAFSVTPPTQSNNYTYVPLISADSIMPGVQLEMEIIYSLVNTASSSPFAIDYSYTNLCGDAGPPAVQDSIFHEPLFIGSFDCTQGVANCFQVIASQNTINCVGSPISISCATIGDTTGLTYQWTSNPTGFTGIGTTITPNSPSVVTTYIVVATDSFGVTTRDSVTVIPFAGQCCIPVGFSLANGDIFFNNATASTFVQQYQTNLISTAQKILIAGTFTVDTNFTFAGCPNLIMAPGALIDVLPNVQFIVDDSHMYSCGNMSQGINAQANSSVRMKGSVIEDAQYAVNLGPNAEMRSVANYFKNNYISINAVSSLPANNPMSIQMNISNTVFESTRSLLPKYTGQTPIPITHPLAGINVSNIINVTLNPDTGNVFRNMNVGILANRTTVYVKNCKFKDILNYDAYAQAPRLLGSAIYAKGSVGTYSLTYIGKRDSLAPDFENCINGVKAKQMSISVANGYFKNVDVGVESERSNLADISAKNNTIECNLTGISLLSNLYPTSLLVYGNEIRGGYSAFQNAGPSSNAIGIDLQGNNYSQFGGRHLVVDNKINLGDYGHTGIHVNYSKFFDVLENLVTLENDRNTNMVGIAIENTEQSIFSCNEIEGFRSNQSMDFDEAAIRYISSLGNVIGQNAMNYTSQGIDVIGVCDNGVDQTTIEKNLIGFHFNGLRYRGSAIVCSQINTGNRWIAPFNYPGYGAINLNIDTNMILFEQFLVNGSGQSSPPNRIPQGWFFPNGQSDLQLNFSDCDNFGASNPNPIPNLLKLSDDSIRTIEYHQELNWQSKVNVYKKLIQHPEYLVDNPDLADFYILNAATAIHFVAQLYVERDSLLANQTTLVQNIKNNSIDIYEKSETLKQIYKALENINLKQFEIDSLIQLSDELMVELDQSIQLNDFYTYQLNNSIKDNTDLIGQLTDSIQGTEIYVVNEAQISEIESYIYENPEDDSLVQFNYTLTNIATQCPLAGGIAVFKARAILKGINPSLFYDDVSTCIQSGIVYRKKEIVQQYCNLYPNPTSGTVSISYSIPADATITVTDAIGKNLLVGKIDSQLNSATIDLSRFQTGLYFYRISNDSDVRFNGKIILTK